MVDFFLLIIFSSLAMVSTIPELEVLEGRGERDQKVLRKFLGDWSQHDFTFSGTGTYLKQHLPWFFGAFCGCSPAVAPLSATPLA